MNPIETLPNLDWSDVARREIELTGARLVEQSTYAYCVNNVAVAGLIYTSFLSPPWFWFALANGITMRDLIDFRRKQELIPRGAMTAILADDDLSIRFAKFYGFEDTDVVIAYHDQPYKIFRRT